MVQLLLFVDVHDARPIFVCATENEHMIAIIWDAVLIVVNVWTLQYLHQSLFGSFVMRPLAQIVFDQCVVDQLWAAAQIQHQIFEKID